MKVATMVLCLFFWLPALAQSERDTFIKDSVHSILNSDLIQNRVHYERVKKRIAYLESKYGYETNMKRRMLEPAYVHKDMVYLQQVLTTLVKDHGFQVAYMTGDENYYDSIIKGELAGWFKEMYIKNNATWLENNFDKQIELRKLNAMHEMDQYLTKFAMKVLNVQGLSTGQQDQIKQHLATYYFENLSTLINITVKNDAIPTEKNFATLQKGYDTILVHNFQFKQNMDESWKTLFPYLKKAYLNHEIIDNVFRNYDFYCYQHNGYQVFDSYTIDQIPEQFRKSNELIPVRDTEWLQNIKREFKWK
jgi:hypothetical protein